MIMVVMESCNAVIGTSKLQITVDNRHTLQSTDCIRCRR